MLTLALSTLLILCHIRLPLFLEMESAGESAPSQSGFPGTSVGAALTSAVMRHPSGSDS
jgi:hypothetical protein